MAEPGDEERRLWRRWRALGTSEVPAPDALALAAYAEFRLSESESEIVENWLAAHPEALAEIVAARAAAGQPHETADDAMIAAACALVSADGTIESGKVVRLRPVAPRWRNALAWSSVAASLIAASLVGFAMGSDAYQHLSRSQTGDVAATDALEASSSLDTYFSDDSGT